MVIRKVWWKIFHERSSSIVFLLCSTWVEKTIVQPSESELIQSDCKGRSCSERILLARKLLFTIAFATPTTDMSAIGNRAVMNGRFFTDFREPRPECLTRYCR